MKPLNLIVACDETRIMGREGKLPWRIPEDHAWFHEKTAGQIVVLGRICYETWPQVHAEGRRPIVITRRSAAELQPVAAVPPGEAPRLARSVEEALAIAQELPGEIYICGGERIFEETLPRATRLFLTLVHARVEGDVRFPEWRHLPWRESYRREGQDASFRYTFLVLEK